jgi:hypothetical protein
MARQVWSAAGRLEEERAVIAAAGVRQMIDAALVRQDAGPFRHERIESRHAGIMAGGAAD